MKTSHFTTPRRLEDCTFQTWGEAIEPAPSGTKAHPAEWFILGLFAVVVVSFAWGWL